MDLKDSVGGKLTYLLTIIRGWEDSVKCVNNIVNVVKCGWQCWKCATYAKIEPVFFLCQKITIQGMYHKQYPTNHLF